MSEENLDENKLEDKMEAKNKHLEINKFYDINQFPQEEGLLLWGISMNRIGNTQSPENKMSYLEEIDKKIKKTEGIGLVTLYSDYLYFNSQKPAINLKTRYVNLMIAHKQGFLNQISKDPVWIKKGFSFYTYGQMILDNSTVYTNAFAKILDMYHTDEKFKNYVLYDSNANNKAEEGELGAIFILEEITLFYLFIKGLIVTNNNFVKNPVWHLTCYPGKPLKSEVYLFQVNPLNLSNTKNKYDNCCYDLKDKILYDYTRLDIDTFDFES